MVEVRRFPSRRAISYSTASTGSDPERSPPHISWGLFKRIFERRTVVGVVLQHFFLERKIVGKTLSPFMVFEHRLDRRKVSTVKDRSDLFALGRRRRRGEFKLLGRELPLDRNFAPSFSRLFCVSLGFCSCFSSSLATSFVFSSTYSLT